MDNVFTTVKSLSSVGHSRSVFRDLSQALQALGDGAADEFAAAPVTVYELAVRRSAGDRERAACEAAARELAGFSSAELVRGLAYAARVVKP